MALHRYYSNQIAARSYGYFSWCRHAKTSAGAASHLSSAAKLPSLSQSHDSVHLKDLLWI